MEIKNIIISLVLGLLVFVVGIGLGILYQSQQVALPQVVVQPQNAVQTMPEIVKTLSSKVVPSIAAQGVVLKINGRNITLAYQGDDITIGIRDDAKIYSISALKNGTSASKKINFQDIKNGDSVSVNFRVLSTGQIEGFNVIVLPPLSTPL